MSDDPWKPMRAQANSFNDRRRGVVSPDSLARYPKQYMKDWFSIGPSRGSFKMLQSKTSKGQPMYALCWADRKPKCIISNRVINASW
ncbi:uncharacterized protein PITG_04782 [Phytophthora infestans T30-4]|uniref:PiggyBac transposable element-derived protein domain-containing protein n=1 Tax=Phytophthora infestans (strain T30-4) TaxID=403677 RepID=D0N214_PHYIT|nr:uncharacterized protein PITG_04782 [Phytophthora infestans T30-4]EEY68343.1 hypothetical protein PITG_04782 [Phytophthora infestans T30-4]|eukprot:XP_002905502.1 hypothetical protein PITG_04782 [Phytophthora infestans T30-4]